MTDNEKNDVLKRLDCMDRKLTELTLEFHGYRDEWTPMLGVLTHLDTAGKSSVFMGRVIMWGGGVCAALGAMYFLFHGGTIK